MSIRIMNRVWDLSQADGGALLALLALADNATDEGYAWPSIALIAQRARLSTRQTTTVLTRLRETGEIDYIIGRGRGNVSVYVVLVGLAEQERQQKVKELHDKADEIMQSLQVMRDKKAQKLRVLNAENMKSARRKHEVEIEPPPSPMPNDALIHHEIHDHDRSPPIHPHAADAAGDGGDGGGASETITILQQAGVMVAADYANVPPAVAEAAVAHARQHRDADIPGKLGALVVGLLKRWRDGRWSPAPPTQEVPANATPNRPRAGRRGPAPERPAGSGPPPGVRTPTAEDLASWGIGPGRPWPSEPS